MDELVTADMDVVKNALLFIGKDSRRVQVSKYFIEKFNEQEQAFILSELRVRV